MQSNDAFSSCKNLLSYARKIISAGEILDCKFKHGCSVALSQIHSLAKGEILRQLELLLTTSRTL